MEPRHPDSESATGGPSPRTAQRALVYLDQNVLSEIAKGIELKIAGGPDIVLVPVYSHAHLAEMASWEDVPLRDRTLDWLISHGARQVQLATINSEPGGVIDQFFKMAASGLGPETETVQVGTDRAFLLATDPRAVMMSFAQQMGPGNPMNIMMAMGLKFAGGLKGQTFAEVMKGDPQAFQKLHEQLTPAFEKLAETNPEAATQAKAWMDRIATADADLAEAQGGLLRAIVTTMPDERNFAGIPEYREKLGIDTNKAEKIEPPGILEKLWKLVREQDSELTTKLSFETFWGLAGSGDPAQESLSAKIVKIHTQLNHLGYWADKKLHKETPFTAAARDGWHLSSAMFCHAFITMDKRLFKKAEAIFEHLKIRTALGLIADQQVHWSKIHEADAGRQGD
jgi:hypothetical protein